MASKKLRVISQLEPRQTTSYLVVGSQCVRSRLRKENQLLFFSLPPPSVVPVPSCNNFRWQASHLFQSSSNFQIWKGIPLVKFFQYYFLFRINVCSVVMLSYALLHSHVGCSCNRNVFRKFVHLRSRGRQWSES